MQNMVKIAYFNESYSSRKGKKEVSIQLTDNHPVLINGEWIEAGKAKAGDRIRLFATKCKACGKLIPFTRWHTAAGDESNYCSLKCSTEKMNRWTDRPKEETIEIRKKISKYKKENNPMFVKEYREKMGASQKTRLSIPGARDRLSEIRKHFILNNPFFSKEVNKKWRESEPERYREIKKKQGETLKKRFFVNPELHPNRTLCNVTEKQRELYNLVSKKYKAFLEYPVKTKDTVRFADILLPKYKIILEHHSRGWYPKHDEKRDKELKDAGYSVIHFREEKINDAVEQINRLIKNHTGQYEFVDVEITSVEQYTKRKVKLYNLSVEEDESYIAKGFVVHNCCCTRIALYNHNGVLQSRWNEPSPYKN
jgi:very-short-patch-repair endonuclease